MLEQIISVDRMEQAVSLFGSFDENIRLIEQHYGVDVVTRGTDIKISGEPEAVTKAVRAVKGLLQLINRGEQLNEQNVRYVLMLVDEGSEEELPQLSSDSICITAKGRPVKPKTLGQKKYVEAIRDNTIVLGVGPAGTGKTYLAVALAVTMMLEGSIDKIILSRPAVEAGENLGFLPGDLKDKVDPYLRPLYDALYEMLPAEQVDKKLAAGEIEIAPLAFMRGRTLSNAFVILDEAQNTTPMQMKMFLTRLGENSRMVVNGDLSQVDLPRGVVSGLRDALDTLRGVGGISSVTFSAADVVRHGLVAKIVRAYEQKYHREEKKKDENDA